MLPIQSKHTYDAKCYVRNSRIWINHITVRAEEYEKNAEDPDPKSARVSARVLIFSLVICLFIY